MISRNSEENRLKLFLTKNDIEHEVYLEIFNKIYNSDGFIVLSGNDFHAADYLSRNGFFQKLIIPIIKQGFFCGNEIYFKKLV